MFARGELEEQLMKTKSVRLTAQQWDVLGAVERLYAAESWLRYSDNIAALRNSAPGNVRGTRMVLGRLCALGLVRLIVGGGYHITEAARAALARGRS